MQSTSTQLPVRGNDVVEILTNDHTVIKDLLNQLTQATGHEQRKKCVESLKGALTVHNATEENIVYPALNKVAKKAFESMHLYHETADADIVLFELDTMLEKGREDAFAQKAENFRDAILSHVEDEEQKAFPHLKENAEESDQELLTRSVRKFRDELHFDHASM